MKRRNFLQYLSSSFILPVSIDGYGAKAFAQHSPFVQALMGLAGTTDKVLVIIQMQGGNDGLNMVIPLDQMSTYNSLRNSSAVSNIAIPENKALALGTTGMGLHPAMIGMKQLYTDGKLAVVQGVSYPNPSFSHFRASDIYMTAVDSNQNANTGWLGRYLDGNYPNYPNGYPNATYPDPPAIQIGSVVSTAVIGTNGGDALVFQDPDTFAKMVGDKPNVPPTDLPATPYGDYVAFIRQQQSSGSAYATRVKAAANAAANIAPYPTGNNLADQLKIVARLIKGGLQTNVYYVSIGGFDTHSSQTDATDTTIGNHANLLKTLSDAITAFQTDLAALGIEDRVAGMTFSEFGRRAASNASRGTDHGLAAPLFVFGKGVKQQKIGTTPNLSNLDNGNIRMQYDFRQVYATLLTDWLGVPATTVSSILFRSFTTLPIFKAIAAREAFDYQETKVYPNPTSDFVMIEAQALESGIEALQLVDMQGYSIPVSATQPAPQRLQIDVRQLPAGNYLLNIQTPETVLKGKVQVIR
ncbi:MAG: DUF1501 domain-containing protein [Spirosomataceae bacterium]